MFYKKKGFPDIGELIICNVKKILPHSIFVEIEEYGKEGMIHISEIAPGRIRNLRDYVKEGKKIVCKVLNINQEKGHIDLSLRRVNQSQKIRKTTEYKQEQRAEKILENVGKELKITIEEVYEKAGNKIVEEYGALTPCYYDIVNGKVSLKDLGIDPKIDLVMTKKIKEKIQPPSVSIISKFTLRSYSPEGVEDVKKVLKSMKSDGISLSYLGAPTYRLVITAPDYKEAENKLKILTESSITTAKKSSVEIEFKRK